MFVMTEGKRIVVDVLLQNNYGTTLREVAKNARAAKKLQQLRIQAEQDRIQAICNLYSVANLLPDVIAKAMNLDIKYVQEIIAKHKETKQ
jgi:hypothetical protein